MTNILITNASDLPFGGLDLREAVAEAQPGDVISFAAGITAVTLLSSLVIDSDITIESIARPVTITQAADDARVIEIDSGASVTLQGVTITGGTAIGAAGGVGSTGSHGHNPGTPGEGGPGGTGGTGGGGALGDGGGILNEGTLTLINDVITGNTVIGGAGGEGGMGGTGGTGNQGRPGGAGGTGGDGGPGGTGEGGGIENDGRLVLLNTTVTGNVAEGGSGGVGGLGGVGGAGGSGYPGEILHEGTRTATGPGGPGGNGGTGGNGGNGGPGGLATGGDIENTGALLIEGTSSIGSGSLISGSGGIAGFPGIGGILGSGGSGDPDGTDGVDGGTGGLGQPGTTGAAGIAGLDTPGAAIILPTLAYVGKTNALFDLSGISIADSLSGLEMKLVTSSGTLYGTPPGATSVQHGTELVFSGSQTSIDAALTTLEFKANSNGTAKIQIALDDEGGNIAVGTITAQTACFAAGTRITTTRGETEVEDLRNGDLVMTAAGAAPVRWIGHRRIAIAGHPNPRQVRPIRLRRNSLADSVPRRDLLVSPDHALFLDGVLIPARLLVNGATIVQEETFDTIEYFHVELDRHAILLAEGAAAESYLDTGNRGMFDNARGKPTPSIGGQQQRQALSCAELMTDPARVEPLWQLLAVRAMELGFAVSLPRAAGDPELHVLADGRKVAPSARRDGRYTFVLPALTGGARLVSHAAAPCDARPWIEDRRRLGVMVHRLSLRSGAARATIPLDHPALREGWWAMEGDGADVWRWTDGDAVLPETQGTAILEVEVAEAPGDQTGSTLRSRFVTDVHFAHA